VRLSWDDAHAARRSGGCCTTQTLVELTAVVDQRVAYHNHDRRHSALGYVSPSRYLAQLGFGDWQPDDPS